MYLLSIAILAFSLVFVSCADKQNNFVCMHDVDSSVVEDMRYFSSNNFVGTRLRGYEVPRCILTQEAANALTAVQKELHAQGLSLRVFDCYRPQRAVDNIVEWAKDLSDTRTKKKYYPRLDKESLLTEGHIQDRSSHSRGSTVDLTIDILEMGTDYAYFDPLSQTRSDKVNKDVRRNRKKLKEVMEKHGFKGIDKEWWHFTLQNEPYPHKYFDFVIK